MVTHNSQSDLPLVQWPNLGDVSRATIFRAISSHFIKYYDLWMSHLPLISWGQHRRIVVDGPTAGDARLRAKMQTYFMMENFSPAQNPL